MESAQLSDEVISQLNDEQLTVLQDLGELAAKKLKLASLIEQFTQQVTASQKTMGFQTKADPGGLHEDPEVLSLVTIKERFKITNLSEQIRRTLRHKFEKPFYLEEKEIIRVRERAWRPKPEGNKLCQTDTSLR